MALSSALHASPEQAQRLIDARRPAEAMDLLREDLVRHPQNSSARYNYAVGAYAAGAYAASVDVLDELAGSTDPEISHRSQFQLGNANFRLAEAIAGDNPVGAAQRFEDSAKRFEYAAGQRGPFSAAAAQNLSLAHAKASSAYLQAAHAKIEEGDRAALVQPEDGFPAWEASLELFERSLKHSPTDASIAKERAAMVDRLATETFNAATQSVQRGAIQERVVPERAAELYRKAIGLFGRSTHFGNGQAAAGTQDATKRLGKALLAVVDRQATLARTELSRSAAAAIEALSKATANLDEAERIDPANAPAAAEARTMLGELWHQAYVLRGDERVKEADSLTDPNQKITALLGANDSYGQALRYAPHDEAAQKKKAAVMLKLAEQYEAQGREFLDLARSKAESNLEEALAAAEKSVQSFERALAYNPASATATRDLEVAKELLRQLREKNQKDQLKRVEKSRDDLKDTKDIKELPKNLALKLLDYRNDKPASKQPQLLLAPENKPLQDW